MLDAIRLESWDEALLEFARVDIKAEVAERSDAARRMAEMTHEFWLARDAGVPIAVFGALPGALISDTAYVWVIPFETYRAWHVRGCWKMVQLWAGERSYRRLVANCFNPCAVRFALFFGFTETAPDVFERVL